MLIPIIPIFPLNRQHFLDLLTVGTVTGNIIPSVILEHSRPNTRFPFATEDRLRASLRAAYRIQWHKPPRPGFKRYRFLQGCCTLRDDSAWLHQTVCLVTACTPNSKKSTSNAWSFQASALLSGHRTCPWATAHRQAHTRAQFDQRGLL